MPVAPIVEPVVPLTPFRFQSTISDAAVSFALDGIDFLIVSPTGTGKSVMISLIYLALAHRHGLRVRVFTSRDEIRTGIIKCGVRLGIPLKEMEWIVVTPMTFQHRLAKGVKGLKGGDKPPQILIIDEAHHSCAATWQAPLAAGDMHVVGLTATPMRGDESETPGWRAMYDKHAEAITLTEAIRQRYLAPFYFVREAMNWIGSTDARHDKFQGQMDNDAETGVRRRMKDIFDLVNACESRSKRPTLIAAPTLPAASAIVEHLRSRGQRCEFIHDGVRSKVQRKEMFKVFKNNEAWLVGLDIILEGVDFPNASRLVCLRRCQALNPVGQFIGRGLRPLRDDHDVPLWHIKKDCEILDFTDNIARFRPKLQTHMGLKLKDLKHVLVPDLSYVEGRTMLSVAENYTMYSFSPIEPVTERGQLNGQQVWAEVGRSLDGDQWAVNLSGPDFSVTYVHVRTQTAATWQKKRTPLEPLAYEITIGGRRDLALKIGTSISAGVADPPISAVSTTQLLVWSLLHFLGPEGSRWEQTQDAAVVSARQFCAAIPTPQIVNRQALARKIG